MNVLRFTFCRAELCALPSGALYWPAESTLIVSDLHLGKAERTARRGGPILPPYEVIETLDRLLEDIAFTSAKIVICLGDSFDDLTAAKTTKSVVAERLAPILAGRRWVWIEGNHDPGPVELTGEHLAELSLGPLTFRHIAQPTKSGEVSGHYHPKTRLRLKGRTITRRCFLVDDTRIILPAYGTYTGGLFCHEAPLMTLVGPEAQTILTGPTPRALPLLR